MTSLRLSQFTNPLPQAPRGLYFGARQKLPPSPDGKGNGEAASSLSSISTSSASGEENAQASKRKGRMRRAILLNLEYAGRVVGSTYTARKFSKEFNHFLNLFKDVAYDSPEHIQALQKTAEFFVGDREIEVNTESGRIEALAKSDEACIFLMNHDYQSEDPSMLGMFSMILYQEYLNQGKGGSCPRPKIILNQDILTSISDPTMRALYEKMGAVGVDASLDNETETVSGVLKDWFLSWMPGRKKTAAENRTKVSNNSRQMLKLLKEFNGDQSHLFLFPEGRMSAFSDQAIISEFKRLTPEQQLAEFPLESRPKNLPLEEQLKVFALRQRFQTGIGDLIRSAARRKKRVKVVPLGFAFNTKETQQKLGSIFVGEPVYFQQGEKGQISASVGNVTTEDSPIYARLFHEQLKQPDSLRPFKEEDREVVPAIAGVLCENLRICKSKAIQALPETSETDTGKIKDPLQRA